MKNSRILTCVYCGMEYPQDTPAWGDKVLTDHIKVCEKHPMKKLFDDYCKVRKALVDLVGVDTLEELNNMETQLRTFLFRSTDIESNAILRNTINAVVILRDTLHSV